MTQRYVLDASARRYEAGRVLVGGSPMRLFRLTETGARAVDAIAGGREVPEGPRVAALLERLLDAGLLHPQVAPARGTWGLADADLRFGGPRPTVPGGHLSMRQRRSALTEADVTVVVPAKDRDPNPAVSALANVRHVVVVDDGSAAPLQVRGRAAVVRLEHNCGPAAARNVGLAAVTTPLVAFVDTDCIPEHGWLDAVLPHFDDLGVGLVAPRVTTPGEGGSGYLARYEAARSPLDLGPAPARVRAGTRVSYVPAAALVVRTAAIRSIGGFDETLRAGEDVDLVWRLDEAGWRCRYEPAAVVHHAPRTSLRGLLAQRAAYGASAAPLARRHPGKLAPLVMSTWSAAAWILAATGPAGAVAGVGVGLAAGVPLRRATDLPNGDAARFVLAGHLQAGAGLAQAVTRVWWPIALPAALASRRVRRAVAVAALVPPVVAWLRHPPRLDPVRYGALRLLDDAAYGWGVWRGALRERTAAPLLPRITGPWPWRHRSGQDRPPSEALGRIPDRSGG